MSDYPTPENTTAVQAQLDQLIDLVPGPFKMLHEPFDNMTFIDAMNPLLRQARGLAIAFRWAMTVEDATLDFEQLADGLEVLTDYLAQVEKVCALWWQTTHGHGQGQTREGGRA